MLEPMAQVSGAPGRYPGWNTTGRSSVRCPTCEKSALIEIRMHVAGSELTFRRCGGCEVQIWESPEGEIPLDRVLELVRHP